MRPVKLIGLSGYAQVGKSTIAAILRARYAYGIIKFAWPMKSMLRALGLSDEEVEGGLKELPSTLLMGRTPRYAMLTLGTEWGRKLIHEDFWVNAMMHEVDAGRKQHPNAKLVIDDVRFPNEANAILARGGEVWRVMRDTVVHIQHESEQPDALPFTATIYNHGTLNDLATAVRFMMGEGDGEVPANSTN